MFSSAQLSPSISIGILVAILTCCCCLGSGIGQEGLPIGGANPPDGAVEAARQAVIDQTDLRQSDIDRLRVGSTSRKLSFDMPLGEETSEMWCIDFAIEESDSTAMVLVGLTKKSPQRWVVKSSVIIGAGDADCGYWE
jgi:hypothetical protein